MGRRIPGFSSYEIDEYGNITSFKRISPSLMKTKTDKDGYLALTLISDEGKAKTVHVHRLVALTFIGYPNGMVVNHIDKNVKNNKVSNLEYVSVRDNTNHGNISREYTSQYPGVYFSKKSNKWGADVSVDGKKFFIGYFNDEIEAAKNYLYVVDRIGQSIKYKTDLIPEYTNPSIDTRLVNIGVYKKQNKEIVCFNDLFSRSYQSIRDLCRNEPFDRRSVQRSIKSGKPCKGVYFKTISNG